MGYQIKIGNKTYDLKDGFTIKEEFNETLDSAEVNFATYGEELDVESFDRALISHTENKITEKTFNVDSLVDDIYCFNDQLENSDHLYTMNLFSQTKELERITLPSCSISQPLDPDDTRIDVYSQITRFINGYMPKIKVRGTLQWTYHNNFRIDSSANSPIRQKFEGVDCPELQWDNPTLREVLNDLFSTKDCIPVVKDYKIDFYDLTKKNNPIDKTKLSRMTSTVASSDYVTELTMNLKNCVGKTKVEAYKNQCLKTVDESGEITTKNAAIITQHPIYSIKKLVIKAILNTSVYPADLSDATARLFLHSADVADRTIEYEAFRLKSHTWINMLPNTSYSNLPKWTDKNGCRLPEHQVHYLYYKRGGKSIENFTQTYAGIGADGYNFMLTSLPNIYQALLDVMFPIGQGTTYSIIDPIVSGADFERYKFFYEIEYETLDEHSLHFGRYLPNNHPENRMFDNQENAYVDVEHQSIFEYAKVNRLGNKIKEIYGEYENENEIPVLGDYIDDYILFSKETSYFDNKFLFHGFLTENYILKNYYTGVLAKKRSWQIASQENALSKHEVIKFYVEASFRQKNDHLDNIGLAARLYTNLTGRNNTGLIYDLTYIKYNPSDTIGGNKPLNRVRIRTVDNDSNPYPEADKSIALDSDVEIFGRSLCWTFGFEDNYKAADYVIKESDLLVQDFYPYTNNYGNYSTVFIDVCYDIPDEFVDANGDPYTLPTPLEEGGTNSISSDDRDAILNVCRKKPLCSSSWTGLNGFQIRLNKSKDMREISKFTIQFEYCSDTPDIIITSKFLEYVRAKKKTKYPYQFKVWYSYEGTYNLTSTKPLVGSDSADDAFIVYTNIGNDSIKIGQNAITDVPLSAWCITDLEDNILLAVNGDRKEVYFNLLATRDTNIYTSDDDRSIFNHI